MEYKQIYNCYLYLKLNLYHYEGSISVAVLFALKTPFFPPGIQVDLPQKVISNLVVKE